MIHYNARIPDDLKRAITPDGFGLWVFKIYRERQPISWENAFTLAAQTFVFYFDCNPPITYTTFKNKKRQLLKSHSK